MQSEFKIYWNNVCLLSRMEEMFIRKQVAEWSRTRQETFTFEFFGLGRKMKLHEKIEEDLAAGDIKADGIVCTDLEVFQDRKYLLERMDIFKNLYGAFPVRNEVFESSIMSPCGRIQPSILIPMNIIVNKAALGSESMPRSLEELTLPQWEGKVILGGMDTSAGRSVLMAIWYLYGERRVLDFVRNTRIANVPAMAFNAVLRGRYPVGIVPTLFAERKGIGDMEAIWPEEGAVVIPSYVAVKKNAPESVEEFLRLCLYNFEMQDFYSKSGSILPVRPGVEAPSYAVENRWKIVYPDWQWIKGLDMENFNRVCHSTVVM